MNTADERDESHLWACSAEQSILGALMLDAGVIDNLGGLQTSHFYAASHRDIFEAIKRSIKEREASDIVTVSEALGAVGRLDQVGGIAYLSEMASNTPSVVSAGRYAGIVIDKAAHRDLIAVSQRISESAYQRDGVPVGEKIQAAQSAILALGQEGAERNQPKSIGDYLPGWIERFSYRRAHAGEIPGMPTGIQALDDRFGGLEGRRVYVVAGRPGLGKSSIVRNIGEHIADVLNLPFLFCSQEMPGMEVTQDVIASIGRIDKNRLRSSMLHEAEFDRLQFAIEKLKDIPFVIDEQPRLTIEAVATKARQVLRRYGKIGAIAVDHLQLMAGDKDDANARIEMISAAFKQLCNEMNCPGFMISQLNRKVEERPNKRPNSGDLRSSGAIEQDADVILAIYRDEIYNTDSADKGLAEILCLKDRLSGNTGKTTMLKFTGEYGRFETFSGVSAAAQNGSNKGWGADD